MRQPDLGRKDARKMVGVIPTDVDMHTAKQGPWLYASA